VPFSHRFRRAGLNALQWRSIVECPLTLTSHFRLGFEPIVEIATIPFATELEELVGPFSNLLSDLFSRLSQFLLCALLLSAFSFSRPYLPLIAWR